MRKGQGRGRGARAILGLTEARGKQTALQKKKSTMSDSRVGSRKRKKELHFTSLERTEDQPVTVTAKQLKFE